MTINKYILLILLIFISLPVLAEGGTKHPGILMVFFRSDCPPCLEEMKIIPEIAREHAGLAIEIISLDKVLTTKYIPDALPENVRVVTAGNKEKKMLRVSGNRKFILPFSVFLNEDQKICGKHYGILGTDLVNRWVP